MATSRLDFTFPLFQRWNILEGPVSIVNDILNILEGPVSIVTDILNILEGPVSIVTDILNILEGPVSIVTDILNRGHWGHGSILGAGAEMLLFISNSKRFLELP
jgi:hypothetical protein